MIVHVVLFRPREPVTDAARDAFVDAIVTARQAIPSVRRFWVGRRLVDGWPSYKLPTADFPFAAVVEFDDRDGLAAYMQHPAHEALSRALHATVDAALVFDYEAADAVDARRIVQPSPDP